MTFASPMGLWFLLAALPVLALHLLKPRRAEVTVSSSMLWEDQTVGATAATPWQRIPPTLLLLLQLLLVVLGALLLADPVVRQEAGLAEHTVVVLDTSASMGSIDGSPDRLADAQAEAIALFDEIPRGDVELAALPTGVTHRLVGTTDVNHAITSLQVERTPDGLDVTVVSEVTGGGAVAVPLRFDVDDVTRAVIDVEIEPDRPTVTKVPLPAGERVIARLGGDDLLAIDNTAYAVTRSRSDLAVSIHGELDPFLQTLLDVVPGVEVVDPNVDTPEVSIFSGVPVPDDITRPFIAIAPVGGAPGVTVARSCPRPGARRSSPRRTAPSVYVPQARVR